VADYEVVLDVAHNPSSVYNLVEYLNVTPCKGKTISIFFAMGDKDIEAMIKAAGNRFDSWLLAEQPENPRAAPTADIALVLKRQGQVVESISSDLCQAFRHAQSVLAGGDRLVVFGSFFTVAAVLPLLEHTQ
jgi:dihydrofolate synthase/folylpolyglutamate synthase